MKNLTLTKIGESPSSSKTIGKCLDLPQWTKSDLLFLGGIALHNHLCLRSGGVSGAGLPSYVPQRRVQGRQRFGLCDGSKWLCSATGDGLGFGSGRRDLLGQGPFGLLPEPLS